MTDETVITGVEIGIVDRLRVVFKNKVRHVASIPADFDADMLKRLLIQTPGLFVSFGGGSPPSGGSASNEAQAKLRFGIFAVTAHANKEVERRHGDGVQIGVYQMVQLTVSALHGFDVEGLGSLSFVGIENIFSGDLEGKGVCCYSAVFEVLTSFPSSIDESTLEQFETFQTMWDIPTHETTAERAKWLAGDESTSKPDAKDNVTIPT